MFRVLNEDEARRVVRWKAPDIRPAGRTGAGTSAPDRSRTFSHNTPVTPVLRLPAEQSATESDQALANSRDRGHKQDDPVYQPVTRQKKRSGSAQRPEHSKQHPQDYSPTGFAASDGFKPLYGPADSGEEANNPELLQNARDEAYQQGYEDGLAALKADKISEVAVLLNSLHGSVEDYRQQSIEQEVLALSLKVGELLVRQELLLNPDALYQLVCLGLEQLPESTRQTINVHLSPDDARMLLQCDELDSDLKIVAEPGLNQGQCRIESGASVVYAGVDEWLSVLADQLGLGQRGSSR